MTSTLSYGGIRTIGLANNEFTIHNPFLHFEQIRKEFFNHPIPLRSDFFSDKFKVDIKETNNEYILEAELAGIPKEEIDLSYENQSLKISIKRSEELEKSTDSYIKRERSANSMVRIFYFPNVKEEKIKAELKDGILTITLPKGEMLLKNNRIKIN